MTIMLTGCKLTPRWETLESAIVEATGKIGKLTRIARSDRNCDYRSPGLYNLTFRTNNGDEMPITLNVQK